MDATSLICAAAGGTSSLQADTPAEGSDDACWHTLEVSDSSATCCRLPGLHADTLFAVRVAALSAAGQPSAPSAVAVFSTAEAPAQPGPVAEVLSTSATSVSLTWHVLQPDAQIGAREHSPTYDVEYACLGGDTDTVQPWAASYSGTQLHCDIQGLRPCCGYAFRVRSVHGKAMSAWGAEAAARTEPAAPGAPGPVECTVRGQRELQLCWRAARDQVGRARVMAYRCALAICVMCMQSL